MDDKTWFKPHNNGRLSVVCEVESGEGFKVTARRSESDITNPRRVLGSLDEARQVANEEAGCPRCLCPDEWHLVT